MPGTNEDSGQEVIRLRLQVRKLKRENHALTREVRYLRHKVIRERRDRLEQPHTIWLDGLDDSVAFGQEQ